MYFELTQLKGVVLVKPNLIQDQRGCFARLYCPQEFASAGISFEARQTSLSRNHNLHTLRGMHYCMEPETKLVRCIRGRILDVIFDIRRESATFGKSVSFELSANNATALYIAPGLAHGFLTLEMESDVLYQIDRIYRPGFDAGLRWNDPQFAFDWPTTPAVISARDANYADF